MLGFTILVGGGGSGLDLSVAGLWVACGEGFDWGDSSVGAWLGGGAGSGIVVAGDSVAACEADGEDVVW